MNGNRNHVDTWSSTKLTIFGVFFFILKSKVVTTKGHSINISYYARIYEKPNYTNCLLDNKHMMFNQLCDTGFVEP